MAQGYLALPISHSYEIICPPCIAREYKRAQKQTTLSVPVLLP